MASTQTIAVCDASELKDGQLYVTPSKNLEGCNIANIPRPQFKETSRLWGG